MIKSGCSTDPEFIICNKCTIRTLKLFLTRWCLTLPVQTQVLHVLRINPFFLTTVQTARKGLHLLGRRFPLPITQSTWASLGRGPPSSFLQVVSTRSSPAFQLLSWATTSQLSNPTSITSTFSILYRRCIQTTDCPVTRAITDPHSQWDKIRSRPLPTIILSTVMVLLSF